MISRRWAAWMSGARCIGPSSSGQLVTSASSGRTTGTSSRTTADSGSSVRCTTNWPGTPRGCRGLYAVTWISASSGTGRPHRRKPVTMAERRLPADAVEGRALAHFQIVGVPRSGVGAREHRHQLVTSHLVIKGRAADRGEQIRPAGDAPVSCQAHRRYPPSRRARIPHRTTGAVPRSFACGRRRLLCRTGLAPVQGETPLRPLQRGQVGTG